LKVAASSGPHGTVKFGGLARDVTDNGQYKLSGKEVESGRGKLADHYSRYVGEEA
jgi:hypothetical protein